MTEIELLSKIYLHQQELAVRQQITNDLLANILAELKKQPVEEIFKKLEASFADALQLRISTFVEPQVSGFDSNPSS